MKAFEAIHSDTTPSSVRRHDVAESTIGREIQRRAELQPEHRAMVSSGFAPLSYRELQSLIGEFRAALRSVGFGRRARIAIAVPDSKQAALAILAVACSAVSVPLNPRLTRSEIDSSLSAIRPDAILLVQGSDSEARRAAKKKDIVIIEVLPPKDAVFSSTIIQRQPHIATSGEADEPDPNAPAFILQTSGTTGDPKLIPFSHRNMLAVAARCQAWFNLTPEDRCLCVTPVFYGHGLKVAILTPLLSGGTVVFPTNISKFDYAEWFGSLKPTWYSAGPTTHRLVFDQTQAMADAKTSHSLRFALSSSAPLPQNILEGLQNTLGIPLLEHYSSSEASLIAANLPSPVASKLGSVGVPWPDSVIIVGDDERQLLPGEQGEILVRGPTVISGYLDAPELNSRSFCDGWFKTGDIGSLDEDGYLTLHGRKGDVINRGGEKISPAEIDGVLLRHPAVAEAVAFPIAHPRLGEDVAAAVVLKTDATVTPQDLRQFLLQTLAPFKLPRRIHMVASLPKGPTGKIRRRDLSQTIGLRLAESHTQPWSSSLEVEIAAVWQGLLGCKSIGPDDDFFELGGDSLLATQMLLELERYIGQPLPIEILLGNATIRQLADSLLQKHSAKPQSLLVQLQRGSDERPFIYTSGIFAHGEYYVNNLAKLLGPNQSFYFLRSHGSLGNYIPSIRQMAQNYKQALDAAGISGPYRLGGHCNGALIALELARQLEAEGHTVEMVAMVESLSLNARPSMRLVARTFQTILKFAVRDTNKREAIIDATMSRVWRIVRSVFLQSEPRQSLFGSLVWRAARKTKKVLAGSRGESKANDKPSLLAAELRGRNWWSAKEDLVEFYHQRMAGYIPMPVAAPVLYVISESSSRTVEFCGDPWRNFMPHHEVVVVPGDHDSCVTTQAEAFTDHLRERLMALDRGRVTDVRCG